MVRVGRVDSWACGGHWTFGVHGGVAFGDSFFLFQDLDAVHYGGQADNSQHAAYDIGDRKKSSHKNSGAQDDEWYRRPSPQVVIEFSN